MASREGWWRWRWSWSEVEDDDGKATTTTTLSRSRFEEEATLGDAEQKEARFSRDWRIDGGRLFIGAGQPGVCLPVFSHYAPTKSNFILHLLCYRV